MEGTVRVADKLYEVFGTYTFNGKKEEYCNLFTAPNANKAGKDAVKNYEEHVRDNAGPGDYSKSMKVTKVVETTWEKVRKELKRRGQLG